MNDIQVRIIRAYSAELAKAEIIQHGNDRLGRQAVLFEPSRFFGQVYHGEMCVGSGHRYSHSFALLITQCSTGWLMRHRSVLDWRIGAIVYLFQAHRIVAVF
jgi:hypothetical protein